MKNRKYLFGKTGALIAGLMLCFGMTAMAAPSVKGDTELTAVKDEVVSAEYTITNDEDMESVTLTVSYDRDALTYLSGSGGNNFSGSGGNGAVQLSSKPGDKTASFAISFRGKADEETSLEILSCTITVDGKEIDALSGESLSGEEEEKDTEDEEEESEDEERASFVIDGRTFYVRRPDDLEDFDVIHMDIQGIESRVLKHDTLDVYVVKLRSDNGSYRDNFVYNPDTGNVIPLVQMESGTDHVIIIEPETDSFLPERYVAVDLGWGPKYTLPAYKHVIIDGIDEIQDDTNRYLLYGINQDGEKAWYTFDYDKNSLQLFDAVAYQGEQDYIDELERAAEGMKSEAVHQLERYNTDMGRRLNIILVMTILIIVMLNVIVIMYLRMRKMQMPEPEDEDGEETENEDPGRQNAFVTGNLEENETDFQEPEPEAEKEEDTELEIIDLDEDIEDED